MAYSWGTVSYASTGTKTLTCTDVVTGATFQPSAIRITLGQKQSTSQTFSHSSIGTATSTNNQKVFSTYQDTTGGQTLDSTSKVISHWERVSGTLTEKVAAHIDTTAAPWTSTAAKIIVDTADVNYQFLVEAWN